MFGKDKIADFISEFLIKHGLDPIYICTVFCILISVSYLKDMKNWKKASFSGNGWLYQHSMEP